MSKLFIVLPCYNEEENIREIIGEWEKHVIRLLNFGISNFEIVAVNDGSKDCTLRYLEESKNKYGNITIITHEVNKGLGQAVKTGMDYVRNNGIDKDYLCIMDSDNTQNPVYIFDMLEAVSSKGSDCVVASRYRQNSEITGVSLFRNMLSLGARFYYSLILGIPGVRDYTCGYRLYSLNIIKNAYEKFQERFIEESGFSCMVEILYKIHKSGGKIFEVPFSLRYDLKKGASKMKIMKNILKSMKLAFGLKMLTFNDAVGDRT